jgi:trans-aconitate 2-methyltransferase
VTTSAIPDWNPQQYGKFSDERSQPFRDLIGMVSSSSSIDTAVDLGCGSGELTALAAEQLHIGDVLGIDHSPAMLAAAAAHASPTVRFAAGDLAEWTGEGVDLVLANASLQWVPKHREVLARWVGSLRAGGQIAVQVPANASQATHTVAVEVARRPRFVEAFGSAGAPPDPVAHNVLEPEVYARLLYDLGCVRQHVRLQVYPHVLSNSRAVVEWVRGTTLTRFQKVLDAATYAAFLAEYEARLIDVIGDQTPYFFPFRRILMWGQIAS